MPRNSDLCDRFRGLGITGRTSCPQRKGFTDVTFRDMHMGRDPQGGGILGVASTALIAGKLASSLLFGPVGAKVSNFLSRKFGKNPAARDVFPGEKHIILPTKFGITRANFAGPGTHVLQRVKRGDRGVDGPRGIDAIAMRHDIDYVNARTTKDVREADNRMIAAIKRSSAGKKTKAIVIAALKAKKLGENIGLFDVNTFTQVTEDDNVRQPKRPRGAFTSGPRGFDPPKPEPKSGAGKKARGPPELNPAIRLLAKMRQRTRAAQRKKRKRGKGFSSAVLDPGKKALVTRNIHTFLRKRRRKRRR